MVHHRALMREQRMHRSLKAMLGIVILSPMTSAAVTDLNHLPQPWRQQAVVAGAEEVANVERYLHELTFEHKRRTHPPGLQPG